MKTDRFTALPHPGLLRALLRCVGWSHRTGVTWAALAACLAGTVWATWFTAAQERGRAELRFRARAERYQNIISERVNTYAQVLKGAAGLFAASETVQRDEWRAYFEELDLSERYQGLKVLGYVEHVWSTNLASFLSRVRQEQSRYQGATTQFQARSAGSNPSCYVVKYIEPMEHNQKALGYDIGSEPVRRQAADEACDTGEATLTGPIRLVQAPEGPGVLLLLPLFFNGAHPTNAPQRRACLQGWVYVAFVMEDLMADVHQLSLPGLGVEIFDGTLASPEALLYTDAKAKGVPAPASLTSPRFSHRAILRVGRRVWTLHFTPSPDFASAESGLLPGFVFGGGSFISLLVFGLIHSLAASRQRAVTLANQMTERLRLQERAMLSSNDGIFILDAQRKGHPISYTNPAFVAMTGYSLQDGLDYDTTTLARGDAPPFDLLRLRSALKAGIQSRTVLHERRKDGSPFWAELHVSPVRDDHGQVTHFLGVLQDITERKRAEDEVLKAQKRHQELLDNLNIGVYRNTSGAEGRFLEANPAMVAMFEAGSKEEFLRHGVTEFYVDPSRRRHFSEKLARSGCLKHEELELRTLKGRRFWASVTAVRRQDDTGNAYFDGVLEDITKQKAAAEALQRERMLLRTVLDNLPDSIYAKDVQCRKTLANRADLQIMGCATEAEALGKTDFAFYSREVASDFFADDQSVIQTGQPVLDRNERFVDAQGRPRWLRTSKLPLRDESGRIIGLVGIGRDITQRKLAEQALRESEERFALAVQGTNDGIWDWNITTNAVYFSPRWKSMLGYEEHEVENTFAGWERLLHPEDRERTRTTIQAYFAGVSPTYELEHRLRHKDGSYRWILARGIALRDEQGRPVRMAGSHIDLTERKRAEEQLRAAYGELAQSQEDLRRSVEELKASKKELQETHLQLIRAAKLESVGTLAAGVAHEVKNPLQTILMGLEYLSNNMPAADEMVTLALGDMGEAVQRANGIVRELLQLSAVSGLEFKEEDLNQVIERSLWLVKHELVAAQTEVVRHLQVPLPRVRIDRQRIEQVLINLFINALQAMTPAGTLSVTTRSACWSRDSVPGNGVGHCFPPGEPVVIVEVRDTGPGIPEPHLVRLFDPFFTTKPVGVGTGLGLSVARKIMDLHQGTIEIKNAAEGGALITLVLRAEWKETSWTRHASSS